MKAGTRIFLAASALFALVLVLYYGPLSPNSTEGEGDGNNITDPQVEDSTPTTGDDTTRDRNNRRENNARGDRSNRNDASPPRLSNEGTFDHDDDANAAPRSPAQESPSGFSSFLNNRIKPVDGVETPTNNDAAEQGKSMPVRDEEDRTARQPDRPRESRPASDTGNNSNGASGNTSTPPATRDEDTPTRDTTSGDRPTTPPPSTNQPSNPRSSAPSSGTYSIYTIVEGDRLTDLASIWFGDAKYWTLITDANPGLDPNKLQIGQKIKLPPKSAARKPAPTRPAASTSTNGRTYTVQSGDTLSSISRAVYGSSKHWEVIYNANKNILSSPDALKVDQKLHIPPKPSD